MVNKDKTLTVADLMQMLTDGRITMAMPITMYDPNAHGTMRGLVAVEIHTFKDGSKTLAMFEGATCGDIKDIDTSTEVYL